MNDVIIALEAAIAADGRFTSVHTKPAHLNPARTEFLQWVHSDVNYWCTTDGDVVRVAQTGQHSISANISDPGFMDWFINRAATGVDTWMIRYRMERDGLDARR